LTPLLSTTCSREDRVLPGSGRHERRPWRTGLSPGGWTHTTLESDQWGSARTIYDTRQVVARYVSTATAKPA
jgi:hypothetical protein